MQRYLKVKVQPDAKENRLIVKDPQTFLIHVKAPPEDGRANQAVTLLLAAHLGVKKGQLWLIKGAQSRSKIFELRD